MFRKNFMPQHGHRFGTPETDRSTERTREQKYTVDQLVTHCPSQVGSQSPCRTTLLFWKSLTCSNLPLVMAFLPSRPCRSSCYVEACTSHCVLPISSHVVFSSPFLQSDQQRRVTSHRVPISSSEVF
jgi:hypothetical protein